jgi:hypothetical protein
LLCPWGSVEVLVGAGLGATFVALIGAVIGGTLPSCAQPTVQV